MFEIGREYRRKTEIHEKFKGQRQGGISTPQIIPAIFLFTSDSGESHGYHDEYRDDGIFWYTGEGQAGDMQMRSGNKAILDHKKNNKVLYLFESTRRAHVRFIGTAECIDHHIERRPDREGNDRNVIVFHLDLDSIDKVKDNSETNFKIKPFSSIKCKSLEELREIAITKASKSSPPVVRRQVAYYRAEALKTYIRLRAKGVCEACEQNAPFVTQRGPFLECHHVNRRADGGPDHPKNVIALCPNCHRRAHYALDSVEFNNSLKDISKKIEKGIELPRTEQSF